METVARLGQSDVMVVHGVEMPGLGKKRLQPRQVVLASELFLSIISSLLHLPCYYLHIFSPLFRNVACSSRPTRTGTANSQQPTRTAASEQPHQQNTATMSSDSLAMFRRSQGTELNALAEDHLKHDLRQSDRDALYKAARTVSTYATVGSLMGLGLGVFLAYRLRRARAGMFNAFKAREKPTALKFADGREEAMPDITPFVKPSAVGNFMTFTLLGAGGLFFGGETGLLTGSFRAKSLIWQDKESRDRIIGAFHAFQADALRKQADAIDRGEKGVTL